MIFKRGWNCWKISSAREVSFLVDAASYFEAVYRASLLAQRRIFILGWDFDSRIAIGEDSTNLATFFRGLLSQNPSLEIFILSWDFSFFYFLERQSRKHLREALSMPRLHFKLERTSNYAASHHQKVVAVDDNIAFVGGLDLTQRRWDTPAHTVGDSRRRDPTGREYGPFHDVQMMVSGPIANDLAALCRDRWAQATGRTIEELPASKHVWPPKTNVNMKDVPVAVSRTEPNVRENERLFFDSIAQAQKYIFIENQYLTSRRIADALAARLEEQDGPEIIMIVPFVNTGPLQELTMKVLRSWLIERMKARDLFNRLRVLYPRISKNPLRYVNLHSKVFISDNRFLRIGSSNLNERSMGLDTECDLSIHLDDRDPQANEIEKLRDRLLAEHLGVGELDLKNAVSNKGLLGAVDQFRENSERTLAACPNDIPILLRPIAPAIQLLDPTDEKQVWWNTAILISIGLAILLILVVPQLRILRRFDDPQKIVGAFQALSNSRLFPLWIVASFIILNTLFIATSVLTLAVSFVCPAGLTFILSFSAALISSSIIFLFGKRFGSHLLLSIRHEKFSRFRELLSKRGMATVLMARLFPTPHWFVNFFLGAAQIRFVEFVLGTVLGLFPMILVISMFGRTAKDLLVKMPVFGTCLALTLLAVMYLFRRSVNRRF